MTKLETMAVKTPAELDRFIRVPARLLAHDPNFVTPLMLERREALSPSKNPYFQHAETQFLAGRARRPRRRAHQRAGRPACTRP
jgi:hypothetical protein